MSNERQVYFLRMCSAVGEIKIGVSTDLQMRLTSLRCGSPYELKVLATRPGGIREEAELHRRFAHLKMRGEWYEPGPDLLAYIRDLPEILPALDGPAPAHVRTLEALQKGQEYWGAIARKRWAEEVGS